MKFGTIDSPARITSYPINAQTGTSYTLVLADSGKFVTMNNASANTLTIPLNSSVAFPVGAVIEVDQLGAGVTTIEGATGVTVNGTSAGSVDVSAQYLGATLKKIATDTWIVEVTPGSGSGKLIEEDNGYGLDSGTTGRGTVGAHSVSMEYAISGSGYGAIGNYSFAAGLATKAPYQYNIALGQNGQCTTAGQMAIGAGINLQRGSMQANSGSDTSSINENEIYFVGTGNRLTLADGDAYSCRVTVMGKQADGSCGTAVYHVLVKRENTTTSLTGTLQTLLEWFGDTNIGTPTWAITADNTNDALAIKVTPANATATRWTAVVEYTKINY